MTPEESAEYLKTDDSIANAHQNASNEGQTETPDINEEQELHFIGTFFLIYTLSSVGNSQKKGIDLAHSTSGSKCCFIVSAISFAVAIRCGLVSDTCAPIFKIWKNTNFKFL